VVNKSNKKLTEPSPSIPASVKFGENHSPAEQELKVRHIVSAMTETGKIRDLRNRRQIAENLGRILSKRKDLLNLSELVVSAGISENADPSRLGRFRILPGKKADKALIQRLSQDALAYVRLAKEVAKVTEENSSALIEELVLGTKFDSSGLEAVEIEPFEQLHTLIQKKINALDAKFDLVSYFQNIKEHSLLPIWSHGPTYNGRISSHHSKDRPKVIGWKKDSDPHNYEEWRFQALPCVPLCRVHSTSVNSNLRASIRSGKYRDVDGELKLYRRLYLAIGMFDSEYVDDMKTGERVNFKDTFPIPYLILADEFHYSPGMGMIFSRDRNFRPFIAGGLECQSNGPLFFYDDGAEFEIESMESDYIKEPESESDTNRFWGGPFNDFEVSYRLDLRTFRQLFGTPMSYDEGVFNFERLKTIRGEDTLTKKELTMTLAPRGTIAELMETNLMLSSVGEGGESLEFIPTFLDKLEEDVRNMTSSLEKFMDETRSNLRNKHQILLEEIDREHEKAKAKK
jgi:hypothetical protein